MNFKDKFRRFRWTHLPYFSSTLLGTLALFLFFGLVLTGKPGVERVPEVYEQREISSLVDDPNQILKVVEEEATASRNPCDEYCKDLGYASGECDSGGVGYRNAPGACDDDKYKDYVDVGSIPGCENPP
ncbi:unnamed protein product, partial [marine sediment metagenome]